MQLVAKFKKILYMGFKATLNFRKFELQNVFFSAGESFKSIAIRLGLAGSKLHDIPTQSEN